MLKLRNKAILRKERLHIGKAMLLQSIVTTNLTMQKDNWMEISEKYLCSYQRLDFNFSLDVIRQHKNVDSAHQLYYCINYYTFNFDMLI